MQRNKHGIMFSGLVLLAALGLMAFGAVALRAALPGESTSGKFELAEPVISGASFLGAQEGTAEFSVPTLNFYIACTGSHAEGSFITLSEALATIKFTGCKTFSLKDKKELPCQILNGSEKDVIVATAKFLPILHGGELFVLAEPDSPTTRFATITNETPSECPLPKSVEVTGSVTTQVPSAAAVKPLITFSEAIQKLTGDKLLYGIQTAYINASATVQLTGTFAGYAFSVI